jgi:hypothetical protein
MFDSFVFGFSIGDLQTQVLGILSTPIVVSGILVLLALGLSKVIVRTVMAIAGFSRGRHWDDDPVALGNYWRGVHQNKLTHRSDKQALDDRSYNDAV